jgi:hypothetical protein
MQSTKIRLIKIGIETAKLGIFQVKAYKEI